MSVLWRNELIRQRDGIPSSTQVGTRDPRNAPFAPVQGSRSRTFRFGRLRRATIGLDFGTSSTKCCFREERDGEPYTLVAHDTLGRGTNRLLLPTSVALVNGRLLFGHRAETAGSGRIIHSFKTCLLCQARTASHQLLRLDDPDACPRCRTARPGWFRLGGQDVSAEDLAILYLAVVLKECRNRLFAILNADASTVRININAAAPLDQLGEFGDLEECFQRCVYYAWLLTGQAQDEWPLRDALSAIENIRRTSLLSVEQSPTRVFPETHAAMTAYIMHPLSESGLYGLVDIGAGTTDVAFFWLQKNEAQTKAWYYAAGSRRVGMDNIDMALRRLLEPCDGNLRAARESLAPGVILASHRLFQPILSQVDKHQACILREAMQVDPRDWAWRKNRKALYKLFLVGGGSAFEPMHEMLSKGSPIATYWREEPSRLAIPSTTRVALPDGTVVPFSRTSENSSGHLLILAYGLASPRPDIPRYERDSGLVLPVKEASLLDELKPEGHWW